MGNERFEFSSGCPEEAGLIGNYSNGQRGNYSGGILDRSGSFQECSESNFFGTGFMGDLPPLSQCLMLEPITITDSKCTNLGELSRVFGSNPESNSFGVAHPRHTSSVITEGLKRLKENVLDASLKAEGTFKRFDESLHQLNKYCDSLNLKRQMRNELLGNERSVASNTLKVGIQIHQNVSDTGIHRAEDRAKNVVLNKRVRTSSGEPRFCQGRINALPRKPPLVGKDRDTHKDGRTGSDLVEERTRRFPAGGEGWDRKMKRKRSMGLVSTRPLDGGGELKRAMQHKLSSEPGLQACDPHSLRSGSFNGPGCVNKLDGNSLPCSSTARSTSKSESEKSCLPRDQPAGPNKERFILKGNNKSNVHEDGHIGMPSPVTKGKASRAQRTGPVTRLSIHPLVSLALVGLQKTGNSLKA